MKHVYKGVLTSMHEQLELALRVDKEVVCLDRLILRVAEFGKPVRITVEQLKEKE